MQLGSVFRNGLRTGTLVGTLPGQYWNKLAWHQDSCLCLEGHEDLSLFGALQSFHCDNAILIPTKTKEIRCNYKNIDDCEKNIPRTGGKTTCLACCYEISRIAPRLS